MSYALRRNRAHRGLLGLGEDPPISIGTAASTDPILSYASYGASQIMLKMASKPRADRLAEMARLMSQVSPPLGPQARSKYEELSRTENKDQAVFDAIRLTLANYFADWTAKRAGLSGLGGLGDFATDLRAGFCTVGAGGAAITGGFFDQLGRSNSNATATAGGITAGATAGAQIAGCDLDRLRLQGELALQNAQLSQQTATQQRLQQQAHDERMLMYAGIAGGALFLGIIGYAVVSK